MIKVRLKKYKILKVHNRAIVHMRQQFHRKEMFGLVLGSGVSKGFNIPIWDILVERIALNKDVDGMEILKNHKGSLTSASQMLFEHYRAKELEDTYNTIEDREKEDKIRKEFKRIVHEELWRDFEESNLKIHPYIKPYLNIIKESNLTVNYNFDDTIQTLLLNNRTEVEIESAKKPFETVWDARMQFQSNKGIIYHPNGFLPQVLIEGPSDTLVLLEDSFADQLIASMSGHYSTLLSHLSKNTCLFIGLSLEDSILKHLLRQNSTISPGHYHYYVAYTPRKDTYTEAQKHAIVETNFQLYNLITLFLDDNGIKELGELILMRDEEFDNSCEVITADRKFVFYLTGPVGCGKTTCLRHFRNLNTYSEWPNKKNPLLQKNWNDLLAEEKEELDQWVGENFFIKNIKLRNLKEGLTIIDRTPLDPFTFEDESHAGWKKKASELNKYICSGSDKFKVVKGIVILLCESPEVIATRLNGREKDPKKIYEKKDVQLMYKKFDKLFPSDTPGIVRISTYQLSIPEVVKRIARIIHLADYKEFDLHMVIDNNLEI